MNFQISTWYDTWNLTGLQNLQKQLVPLDYAGRYNLAFGEFVPTGSNGYTVDLNAKYAGEVLAALQTQMPGGVIYAGVGDTGLSATVADNRANNNRSTANIVSYLQNQKLQGITIDSEGEGMGDVAELVTQLGPSFQAAYLGIVISVPWPGQGPVSLYGPNAVAAFNQYVRGLELQDYSSFGTPSDVPVWTQAGVARDLLIGGVATENGGPQTSLADTAAWTQYALENALQGMFSWRLDNDHGTQGTEEDVDPTFTGAKTIWDTFQAYYGDGADSAS
jgi:hypothetical protein